MEKINSMFPGRRSLFCNGKLLDLSIPAVMGIINITTDSFFSGSRFRFGYTIAQRANQIMSEGGSIIDIGACSTRSGAIEISEELELKRLGKALKVIRKEHPNAIISIDTYRASVAERMVQDYGANIINDISAGKLDPKMFETVAKLKVPYILMHMQGTPQNMQQNPQYDDVVKDLFTFFTNTTQQLKQMGISDIILDPGFGFGKNLEHNYTLLKNVDAFRLLEYPVLVGISRKSMIYKKLNITPNQALNGTTVLNTLALQKGAAILRVHDVREAVEAVKLTQFYQAQPNCK